MDNNTIVLYVITTSKATQVQQPPQLVGDFSLALNVWALALA